MITKETRNTIKGYLEGFIQGMVDEAKQNGFDPKQLRPLRNESKAGDLKPFHESLLPDGILRVSTPDLRKLAQLYLSGRLDEWGIWVGRLPHLRE